jgi:hypothetical protein
MTDTVLYNLQHGDHERTVLEQWARGDFGVGAPLPEFLANKPRCPEWAQLYLDAYWQLNGDRAGMGDGRITWVAAHMWARAHQLSRRQEDYLHFYIAALDSVVLKFRAKSK